MRLDHPDHLQTRLDGPTILDVEFNLGCRDEIVPLLHGLQTLYADEAARHEILTLVKRDVLGKSSCNRGRKGLDMWSIFVLGCVRLGKDLDYDALQDLAENHRLLRAIMGRGEWQVEEICDWRRIRDNVCKVQPQTYERASIIVARLGHRLLGEAPTAVRCDSFVMQTNIHYPTDIRQTGDALRCLIRHGSRLAEVIGSTLLRQNKHLLKRVKQLVLIASRASGSKGKNRQSRLEAAVCDLVDFADDRCHQAMELLDEVMEALPSLDDFARSKALGEKSHVHWFLSGLAMVADVARRRLVDGEEVPLSDRLFSVFEAHTELINRGKQPHPIEFGHRCFIAQDEHGFILHAHVMANGRQDRDITSTITRLLTHLYPSLKTISFDRGFHSPQNQERMPELIANPCLPSPGVKAGAAQSEAADETWHDARRRHPGIESAIGALQRGNGCDRCRDRTKKGYRRYLAMGVLGRNLIVLGRLCIARDHGDVQAGRSRKQPIAA